MLFELTILRDLFFFVRKSIVDFQMPYKKLQVNLSGIFIFIYSRVKKVTCAMVGNHDSLDINCNLNTQLEMILLSRKLNCYSGDD